MSMPPSANMSSGLYPGELERAIWSTLLDICHIEARAWLFLKDPYWSTRVETSLPTSPAPPSHPRTGPPMHGPRYPVFCPMIWAYSGVFKLLCLHKCTTCLAPFLPAEPGRQQKMFDKCPHFQRFRQQSLQHLLQNKHGG